MKDSWADIETGSIGTVFKSFMMCSVSRKKQEHYGSGSIMLSEDEKRELREMAASESLRREFRTMRSNSQAIERRIGVDELAHWLTVMARVCPGAPKPPRSVRYTNVKI